MIVETILYHGQFQQTGIIFSSSILSYVLYDNNKFIIPLSMTLCFAIFVLDTVYRNPSLHFV